MFDGQVWHAQYLLFWLGKVSVLVCRRAAELPEPYRPAYRSGDAGQPLRLAFLAGLDRSCSNLPDTSETLRRCS